MTESNLAQASGISRLQLAAGQDSQPELKSARSLEDSDIKIPFSNELKRATDGVKKQAEFDELSDQSRSPVLEKTRETAKSVDAPIVDSELLDQPSSVITVEAGNDPLIGPADVDLQSPPTTWKAVKGAADVAVANAQALNKEILDVEDPEPGTIDLLDSNKTKQMHSDLQPVRTGVGVQMTEADTKTIRKPSTDAALAVVSQDAKSALKDVDVATAPVTRNAPAEGSLKTELNSIPSSGVTLQPGAEQVKTAVPALSQNVADSAKPSSKPVAQDLSPQTVASLPAAAALNAGSGLKGISRDETATVVTPLAPANQSIVLTGALLSPVELARTQAKVTEAPNAEQVTDNIVTPATTKPGPALVNSQVTSVKKEAVQTSPGTVQPELVDSVPALNNLTKQVNQPAAQSTQVIEPTKQKVTSGLSEAANNMFQALPSGIITAPVVQRSELPANLVTSAPYTVPLMNPDADEALIGNVKWMVTGGVQNAVINIAPSGMGPISVQIDIDNEQMNVSIMAAQGGTREALDAMLPRLREQLGAQGIETVRVDVTDNRSSDSTRSMAGQQFGQARGDFSGNAQNNDGSGNGSDQRADNRTDNETERRHVSELQNTAMDASTGGSQSQSLYDAYV